MTRNNSPLAATNVPVLLLLGSIPVLFIVLGLLAWPSSPIVHPAPSAEATAAASGETPNDKASPRSAAPIALEPLLVFCAASQKVPLTAIAERYEQETGRKVSLQFGPSQSLLGSLAISRTGDLFVPADESYLVLAREKKLLRETLPLAEMKAVLVVQRGNPLGVKSLADLATQSCRLAQAKPEAAAIGKLTQEALTKSGHWEALAKVTTTFAGTVVDAANNLKVKAVDAAIIWDAMLPQYPEFETVDVPELQTVIAQVAVGVLDSSRQPRAALQFARYLAAADRGLQAYAKAGFRVVSGDRWAEVPELTLYAGAVLKPAIEATLAEFEAREGVQINRVYNGCGILVAQMRAGQSPDAYFACDKQFLKMVDERFETGTEISSNQLVILVKQGNPHGLSTLADLAKPGLRVGIGHEKQCAMGALTQQTFRQTKVTEAVMKNVVVQAPTGDLLVNQLRVGDLDAAIVYLSNATGHGDELLAIPLDGLACAQAIQPYAIAKDSAHKQLADRLLAALRSAASEQRFKESGFQWGAPTKAP